MERRPVTLAFAIVFSVLEAASFLGEVSHVVPAP